MHSIMLYLSGAGLPDGIFSKPKIAIWVNFGGSCSERCWYILRPFGIFCWFYGHLVYFIPFWYVAPRTIWQPCFGGGRVYIHTSVPLTVTIVWTCFRQPDIFLSSSLDFGLEKQKKKKKKRICFSRLQFFFNEWMCRKRKSSFVQRTAQQFRLVMLFLLTFWKNREIFDKNMFPTTFDLYVLHSFFDMGLLFLQCR
jgi:hypothetical protein